METQFHARKKWDFLLQYVSSPYGWLDLLHFHSLTRLDRQQSPEWNDRTCFLTNPSNFLIFKKEENKHEKCQNQAIDGL